MLLIVSLLISWYVGKVYEEKTNFSDADEPRAFKLQGPARQIYQEFTR